MKRILVLTLLLISSGLWAQEDSVLQQSRDVLVYGIDSEVLELLDRFEDQMENRLDEEILQRFAETRNRTLQARILEHFEARGVDIAGDVVSTILLENEDLNTSFLRTAVSYLSRIAAVSSPELLVRYEDIATDDDPVAASIAISAIGTDGSDEAVEMLFELYDDLRNDELRGSVVRALGDTGSPLAVDMLEQLVSDQYGESSLRQYAAEALGKIGAPESMQVLIDALEDENSILRAYATASLGAYSGPEASQALHDGLRDSYWRVRVAALTGLAESRRLESLAAVEYKALHDPESPVRQEAVRTLAALDDPDAYDILRAMAVSKAVSQADRLLAIQLLVEDDLEASLEAIAEVVGDEWEVENSTLLDGTARALNTTESGALENIYARLLTHPNYIIRIYAIRGIGRSGFSGYGDELISIARDNPTGIVHAAAATSLELLGIPLPDPEEPEEDADDPEDEPAVTD